jgi:hypothetical protein
MTKQNSYDDLLNAPPASRKKIAEDLYDQRYEIRVGNHDDRDVHLTMLSYAEWINKLRKAGFHRFQSTLTSRPPVVRAGWKIFLERLLSVLRIKIMWSHLGVRNVLLMATR